VNCEEMRELLSCYIDGVLDEKDVKDVEKHLEQCPYCQQDLAGLKATLALVHQEGEVQPPEGFRAGIMEKIAALPKNDEGKETGGVRKLMGRIGGVSRSPFFKAAAVAAVLLIGISIGTVFSDSIGVKIRASDTQIHSYFATESSPENQLDSSPGNLLPDGKNNKRYKIDNSTSLSKSVVAYDQGTVKEPYYDGQSRQKSLAMEQPAGTPPAQKNNAVKRKIIKNAFLRVEVPSVEKAYDKITKQVEILGGFIESSGFNAEGASGVDKGQGITPQPQEGPQGVLTIRIPVDKFPVLFGDLQGLGNVVYKNQSGQDVTVQYQDTQTRIRNLKRQEDRLLVILGKAETLDETLRVENELRRVREEVELQEGELKRLTDLTDLATVQVELLEVKSGAKIESPEAKTVFQQAVRSFIRSTNNLLDFLSATVVFLGGALPFLAFLTAAGGIVWYIRKLWKKRSS